MAFIQIGVDVVMVLSRGLVCSNYILKGSLRLLCGELTVECSRAELGKETGSCYNSASERR